MIKQIFQKESNYNLNQLIFWFSSVFFIILGILAFYENNMPLVGLFWVIFVAITYWLIKLGKLKAGIMKFFLLGMLIDFIVLYILHKLHPEEDIAGIVIISLLLSGGVFALIAYLIQKYIWKKKS